jgi:hypothetical protein
LGPRFARTAGPRGFTIADLPATRFEPLRDSLLETCAVLLDYARRGDFPFLAVDSGYCRWCELSPACRKHHLPSRARTEDHPRLAVLQELRTKSSRRKFLEDA